MAKKKLPTPKVKKTVPQQMMDHALKEGAISKKAFKKTAPKKLDPKEEKKPKPIARGNAKRWLERIQRAEKAAKPFRQDADRYLRMYSGDYSERPGKKRNFDQMSVNTVYSHVETIGPAIFSGFPAIRVRPKPKVGETKKEMDTRARNMDLVLNYFMKELGVDDELEDVLHDTFFSHAGVELGWETDIEDREEEFEDEEGGEKKGAPLIVHKDRPFIVRREPYCFLFDPDARRRKDCRWIGVEEVLAYNDFLASSKWTEKAKKAVKPQCKPEDAREQDEGADSDDTKSDKEWVRIFTIWDKENRKVYVITKGYEGWLNTDDDEGQDWPYEIEYKDDPYPFAIHDAKKTKKSPYTWSEFKAYESQMIEQNRIRSAIQIHVKRTLPKYVYTDAAGTRSDISKLMNARSDEATKLNNLEAFKPLENASMPEDLFTLNKMAADDITNTSAIADFFNQSLADTATEASIQEGRGRARQSSRSKKWEKFVVEIAAKLAMLCQQNMSEKVAVEIAGPNGVDWLEIGRDQIQGEFLFDIEAGSMEYKNEGVRQQQMLKFLEIVSTRPELANIVNFRAILVKIAKGMDITPEDIIIAPEKMPPPEPPEASVKFKEIDPTDITDPNLLNALVLDAFKQNNIPLPVNGGGGMQGGGPALPATPPSGIQPPAISGKDLGGGNPNGNPSLPPVAGNIREGGGSA